MKTINLTLFFVAIVLIFSACKKSTVSIKTNTITAEYYLKGTLNGQAVTWQAAIDGSPGYFAGSASVLSRDLGVTTGELTALLSASAGLKPQLGVGFRTFKVNYDQDIPAYFNNFINTGAWAYAANDNHTVGVKALTIYYTDAQGKTYSTIGLQTGSISNVSAVTQVAARLGSNESLKVKLTFSCTLYPTDGTGANLSLTNAEATVLVEDQLY
jgi:hypothetical protein